MNVYLLLYCAPPPKKKQNKKNATMMEKNRLNGDWLYFAIVQYCTIKGTVP